MNRAKTDGSGGFALPAHFTGRARTLDVRDAQAGPAGKVEADRGFAVRAHGGMLRGMARTTGPGTRGPAPGSGGGWGTGADKE